ncbi:NFACT family protein [Lentilactobacillus sp. IMAU92037]|uniref:NFACT RNA binding domain-containing protein n=1 Tax=Lentilactobacillus TaxID=2767893 RepID=UPI001C2807CB|nr:MULTISPECIES: NFACT RNA binding domain-containing protein [Lentilactobacillus]MBU9788996.1 NFACT family protein [Lentilactobacillus dabitei]MBV0929764.1 NFACT family protein [Lentilactobacillus dabitei]MDM7517688.1 NFACT RNA binding domain-containing protein [Lentilactobacillus sp. TOM.63]
MSFDGSFTHSMRNELASILKTGRVSKINQPYPNELILTIRAQSKNQQLLLSANPTYARVQLTKIPYSNPSVPSNFTMIMRKHLSGAILTDVQQLDNDRVLKFLFTSRNELGDQTELCLNVEIMARHSNIILVDQKTSKVIDAIKHVGSDVNRYRILLPGATYINPPKQDVQNPFTKTSFTDIDQLIEEFPNIQVLADNVRKMIQGLGKDTSLALASYLHKSDQTETNFKNFFSQFDESKPTLSNIANNKLNFTAFPYPDTAKNTFYSTLSELLDAYYAEKAQRDRVREQGAVLIQVVKKQLKKNRTKLKRLTRDMAETENADAFKIKGEILTTYLNKIQRGMQTIELPNYYDNNAMISISLSNQLSPSENAQRYFKKYQKLKNAVKYLNEQIKLTQQEIDYFENIQSQIELAKPEDLVDIRYELEQGHYLRDHEQHGKKKKAKRPKINKPEEFVSTDGTEILVGKNNLQNERLTMHTADKRETWLHTKNIPGSHVIVRSFNPSEQTLTEAANLAAYFSKARDSAKVPVDYTKVKHIRKPNGAKPGFVIYDSQQTLFIDPSEDIVNKLRK